MSDAATLKPDPYLVPALAQAIASLEESYASELAKSEFFYAAQARGDEVGQYHPQTHELMEPPLEPEHLSVSYEQALTSLKQLNQLLPQVTDWQSQRNLMTLILGNGLQSVLYSGAPFEALEIVIDTLDHAREIHEELSADAPHEVPARRSERPGDGRKDGESLFDTPLTYGERAITTYDGLCSMVVAMQKRDGTPEAECITSVFQLAVERYVREHNADKEMDSLTEEELEKIKEIARDIVVEVFEPYQSEIPYVVCPEIAWFVVQAAREVADDVAPDGQMKAWVDTVAKPEQAANDNSQHFMDLVYDPVVARRVHNMVMPILRDHADMGSNMHRLTSAMDRCAERMERRDQEEQVVR